MQHALFTLGYEGLSLQAFIARLQAEQVQTLVDVRELPLSRKPGFSKTALAGALAAQGIAYVHVPALGCPKEVRHRYKADGDWGAYTRGFMAHLAGQSAALGELVSLANSSRACLMCFEAGHLKCHRTFVAQAAKAQGGPAVVHLGGEAAEPRQRCMR